MKEDFTDKDREMLKDMLEDVHIVREELANRKKSMNKVIVIFIVGLLLSILL